jgi:hypothetical protein
VVRRNHWERNRSSTAFGETSCQGLES